MVVVVSEKCFLSLNLTFTTTTWISGKMETHIFWGPVTTFTVLILEGAAGRASHHQTNTTVVWRLSKQTEGEWKCPLAHVAGIVEIPIHHGDCDRQNSQRRGQTRSVGGTIQSLFTKGNHASSEKERGETRNGGWRDGSRVKSQIVVHSVCLEIWKEHSKTGWS